MVGFPVGTNCAPSVAYLILLCYERESMISLSDENVANDIETFSSNLRYLDDLLNIDTPYFEDIVNLFPPELQLKKKMLLIPKSPFSAYGG